jgi:hypothetical protein
MLVTHVVFSLQSIIVAIEPEGALESHLVAFVRGESRRTSKGRFAHTTYR